ncbi:histidine kinase [Chitinophaga pendula]|uniref:sensor histidine kinase n=1 Tax=Chitinophaga TaxID=79328 RepID=UPI000BAF2A88|nr:MULTISPECIES: histidine kinase [Chitinophaga]ASZ12504.1 histidine kinase [Chitinophaga sp. MD30]UCJ09892.1 histidine kinase [Chitinophaga pendula]
MKRFSDIRRFQLYVWLIPAFFILNLLGNIVEGKDNLPLRSVNECWLAVYLSVTNYRLLEYTVPKLNWKKPFYGIAILLCYAFAYSLGFYIWRLVGISIHIFTPLGTPVPIQEKIGDLTGYSIGALLFFVIVRHVFNYIKLKQSTQQLRIERQQAELNFLKAQTNPHFLFNTLNNIYALSREKSDLAPESILRLSKILRHMLYDTSGPYIAVEQDLKIIEDYIALEKLRYDESLHVNYNYDLEDVKQSLPPLLLIPLVENAFKHGVSETREMPFIDIHLTIKNRQLLFVVKNSTGDAASDTEIKGNIGLSNLRRQLELLYTDYSLEVQQKEFVFTAIMKINLASHVQN